MNSITGIADRARTNLTFVPYLVIMVTMQRMRGHAHLMEFNHNASAHASENSVSKTEPRGMILAAVLILLGIISGLVIQAQVTARLALRHAERKSLQTQLRAAATDAAWNALHALAGDSDLFVDHTNEPWAAPVNEMLPNGIETMVLITDEHRFFDVNNLSVLPREKTAQAPSVIVAELLTFCDQQDPPGQTQALKDWFQVGRESIARSSSPLPLARGTEHGDASSGVAPPAVRLVESPAELGRILGVTLSSTQVPSVLTALPGERTGILPINVNTATPEVLRAILGGRDYTMVDAICRLRDSTPLTSLAPLASLMDADRLRASRCYLDVKSSFFSVYAQAARNGGSEEIYALVRRDDEGEVEILRWICR